MSFAEYANYHLSVCRFLVEQALYLLWAHLLWTHLLCLCLRHFLLEQAVEESRSPTPVLEHSIVMQRQEEEPFDAHRLNSIRRSHDIYKERIVYVESCQPNRPANVQIRPPVRPAEAFDSTAAWVAAQEDWANDACGQPNLHFDAFLLSVFELADLWTPTILVTLTLTLLTQPN